MLEGRRRKKLYEREQSKEVMLFRIETMKKRTEGVFRIQRE